MNTHRICTVVTGDTLTEFLQNLVQIQKKSDFIELRVDYITGLCREYIDAVSKNTTKPAIFTCRKKSDGGHFAGTEDERLRLLLDAAGSSFTYIDVEFSAIDATTLQNFPSSKILLSYHNFIETPHLQKLMKLQHAMQKIPHAMVKFATMIQNDTDVQQLITLLCTKDPSEKMIISGMGEKGKLLRIIAPFLGSFTTFASTSQTHSADGQIDVLAMQKVYNDITQLVEG